MAARVTKADPRYQLAKAMKADGMTSRAIHQILHVRWDTLTAWLADVTAADKRKTTPPAYATGYRWFGTKWR